MKDWVKRLMGRSVVDLAQQVDEALGRLAQARGLEAQAMDALHLAQEDVKRAQQEVDSARDALFKEHPELVGERLAEWTVPTDGVVAMNDPELKNPSAWDTEVVEVDDTDDPRFTAGAAPTTGDGGSDDLPPIVWEEHDE